MENGCDRLLTSPHSPGSIRIIPFAYMPCLRLFGNPSGPWITTVTVEPCGRGQAFTSDRRYQINRGCNSWVVIYICVEAGIYLL